MIAIPPLLYGTAWKEARTEPLVLDALRAGFRGIDTANQRKHYFEQAVGDALRRAFAQGLVRRDELFLQTKFTYQRGQDHRLPYDPRAPLATQVAQSFASSLEHLGVDALGAYVLHGPSSYPELGHDEPETWRAMEALHEAKEVQHLGVSNVTAQQLRELHALARVKPSIVQNRTFTRPHADAEVRAFCAEHGIAYEGFSLLTAIPQVVMSRPVTAIALTYGATPAQTILAYCLARGMTVLTGTTSREHMAQDLATPTIALREDELAAIDALVA